jgi:Spy/CpxP family protein refolding chaperone
MWGNIARIGTVVAWLGWGAVVAVATVPAPALAAADAPDDGDGSDGHGGDGPEAAGRRMARLADHLQLSPEVRAQMLAIAEAHKDALKKLHVRGLALRAQLEAERLEASPNWKAIGKLLHKAADLKADAELIEMQALHEALALLTPEQRAEVARLRQAHHGDRSEKRGR